ncbi:MAG: hypothetical protein DME99_08555, partial [Verrucomicrobia bacterium]
MSSTADYKVAQNEIMPPPTGPLGALDAKNITPSGEAVASAEPRRFHYNLRLTIRGVYDDNIFI